MRLLTIPIMLVLVAAFALPAGIADHPDKGHYGNYGKCENRYVTTTTGDPMTGRYCALANIGFVSGDHISLNVLPMTGIDIVHVNFTMWESEPGHTNGWNSSAPPVFECTEGYLNQSYEECDKEITLMDVPHGEYVAAMTIAVNESEIAATQFGVTVPTGTHVSGGAYGFEMWYNLFGS